MRRMLVFVIVVLWAAVALAACSLAATANAQDGGEPEEKSGKPIAVEGDARSDRAIAERIRAIFRQLPALHGVEAAVNAGVVVLTGQVADAQHAEDAADIADRVAGVVAVRDDLTLDASVEKRLTPAWERLQERVAGVYERAPLFLAALLLFAAFVIVGLWIARWRWPWQRIAPNAFVADLIRQMLRLAFAAAGVVVALDVLGATALLGTILGAAGILGLAVGFALRDTIENYVASIMLSIRQPFEPNDLVRIDSHEGHVIRLTSRATILMSLDGNHVRIPNAEVFKGVVVNYTRNPERRFEFFLGIDTESNLKGAVEIGLVALKRLDFVLEQPKPVAAVREVGDSNVMVWFAAWIDQQATDFAKGRGEAIRLTKRALEDAGITLPEPIFRVHAVGAGVPGLPDRPRGSAGEGAAPGGSAESPEIGDASREPAVADKVAAERSQHGKEDLLNPTAPRE